MEIQPLPPTSTPAIAGAQQAVPPEIRAERATLVRAVRAVNSSELLGKERELTFAFEKDTGKPLLRIVDSHTREVVAQIPPDYILWLARHLGERAG